MKRKRIIAALVAAFLIVGAVCIFYTRARNVRAASAPKTETVKPAPVKPAPKPHAARHKASAQADTCAGVWHVRGVYTKTARMICEN